MVPYHFLMYMEMGSSMVMLPGREPLNNIAGCLGEKSYQ